MCYHQAGSARFVGHCGGRGWRDATENLLQTSIINHLSSFTLRRICGTKKYNFFFIIPLCESLQVGAVVHGGGVPEQKTNKQNTGCKLREPPKQRFPTKLTGITFFVRKTKARANGDDGCSRTKPHYYTNALSTRSGETREWMRHSHFVDNE